MNHKVDGAPFQHDGEWLVRLTNGETCGGFATEADAWLFIRSAERGRVLSIEELLDRTLH